MEEADVCLFSNQNSFNFTVDEVMLMEVCLTFHCHMGFLLM